MLAVEIRIINEEALVDAMTGMRQWLDHRRFEPATFRYTFTSPGMLCRVDFASEAEAAEFAAAFGGKVVALETAPVAPLPQWGAPVPNGDSSPLIVPTRPRRPPPEA